MPDSLFAIYCGDMCRVQHSLLADFEGLRDRDYADKGLMVCEGRFVIEKALSKGQRIQSLLCVPACENEWQRISAGRFPVSAVPRPDMEALLGFAFHRGEIALALRPELALAGCEATPRGHGLALWNVSDPDNVGTLIRSAAALGARKIYIGPGCADPFGRKAMRTSMACVFDTALIRACSIEDMRDGNHISAAALHHEACHPAQALRQAGKLPHTLIVGNEGWGLPADIIASSDTRVCIPMHAHVDSLNVAAAGAILMWELFRMPE